MRLSLVLPWLVAAAAPGYLLLETKRLAEVAGRFEVEARDAHRMAEAARAERLRTPTVPPATSPDAGVPSAPAPDQGTDAIAYSQLALELATTREQLAAVKALLEQRNLEATQRAKAAADEAARRGQPMPEGVRECLTALHGCLREEGFFGPRFLRASRVGPQGLEEVEMLDADSEGIDVAVIHAARMTATLDRAAGRLELRFFEGERTVRGDHQTLPKDGFALTFADVDGRVLEARLPYLLQVAGIYPAPPADQKPRSEVDPLIRAQWLERFDGLLAKAGGDPTWHVSRFAGMEGGWFLGADLVGTDARRHVVASAHAARFSVEVDPASGVVSLWLRDGSLRRGGVESSITGEGYRVLLPNLSCKQATDAMLGMVVSK